MDPDPHYFSNQDPDPHWSEKLDPDPHLSQNLEAFEVQNGAAEGHGRSLEVCRFKMEPWRVYRQMRVILMRSRIRIGINVKRWIWISIDVKCGIRIPIKVMQILNPGSVLQYSIILMLDTSLIRA
jgi:hypothetical protein